MIGRIAATLDRSIRGLGLMRAARAVLPLLPTAVQTRSKTIVRRIRVRRGYLTKLVPEQDLELRYRQALVLLGGLLPGGAEQLGDYLEFGVCHGTSLLCMHRALAAVGNTTMRLFGFDSFEGLPQTAAQDDEGLWQPGSYKADHDYTMKLLARNGVDFDRTFIIKGWFDATLTNALVEKHDLRRVSVIMVDCDMYLSAAEALRFCGPLIRDHAVIFFDDWGAFGGYLANHRLGERRAFEEFLQANPDLSAEERPELAYFRAKALLVTRQKQDSTQGVEVVVNSEIISGKTMHSLSANEGN